MRIVTAIGLVSMLAISGCSPGPESVRTAPGTAVDGSQAPIAPEPEPETTGGFVVDRIWQTGRVTGSSPAGDIEVTPDRGHALVILDLRAHGDSPVTVDVDGLAAGVGDNRVLPIGAAPFSPSNFSSFAGFVSGWKIVSDAEERHVKMGRDSEDQPIELTVDPGVQVSIVYLVPEEGQPMVVTLPGAGEVPLVPSS